MSRYIITNNGEIHDNNLTKEEAEKCIAYLISEGEAEIGSITVSKEVSFETPKVSVAIKD